MPMISIISENDTFYSVHTDETEAEAYLESLKKRWPSSSWEHDRVEIGTRKNQGKLIWGGAGIWDFDKRELRDDFYRLWLFEGEVTKDVVLTKGACVHRFHTLKLTETDPVKFRATARKLMLKYKTSPSDVIHSVRILEIS